MAKKRPNKYQPKGIGQRPLREVSEIHTFIRSAIERENPKDLMTYHDLALSTMLAEKGIQLTPSCCAYHRMVQGIPGASTRLRLMIAKRGETNAK